MVVNRYSKTPERPIDVSSKITRILTLPVPVPKVNSTLFPVTTALELDDVTV